MASPYLLFASFPKMLAILPKPGPWMSTFKQLTGFMLLATATWLIWIFGVETSATAVTILLVGLWLAAVGAWILGRWGTLVSPRNQRLLASVVFIFCILSSLVITSIGVRYFDENVPPAHSSDWQSFSPEKLADLREKGIPVFVNFTAKWCLTCQLNKPLLHANMQAFAAKGVVTLEADWTKKIQNYRRTRSFRPSQCTFLCVLPCGEQSSAYSSRKIIAICFGRDGFSQ